MNVATKSVRDGIADRHRELPTLTTYDDNRADLAGDVAALVAGAVLSSSEWNT